MIDATRAVLLIVRAAVGSATTDPAVAVLDGALMRRLTPYIGRVQWTQRGDGTVRT